MGYNLVSDGRDGGSWGTNVYFGRSYHRRLLRRLAYGQSHNTAGAYRNVNSWNYNEEHRICEL